MQLKTENYIFIATNTSGFSDEMLIEAVLGFLPTKKETTHITGSERAYLLWSKTRVTYDVYYSAIDASVRLHNLSDDLDYYVTNNGDILIYRQNTKYCTPQDVIDSYHRYIGSKEENKEDKRMGTILHEGEYILLSKKITDSILSMGGYSILARIGINTSKINYNLQKFDEGYNYTLNFTIDPDVIIFDANVSTWSDINANKIIEEED